MKKELRLQKTEETGPLHLAWSNPEPQPFNIGAKADMRVVDNNRKCEPKPAIIHDAETGKKLLVLSFRYGDRLEVEKPEAIGLPEKASLEIMAYGYDEEQNLYALTPGNMPKHFRTKATFPETHEVVFTHLPDRIAEHCIADLKGVFRLRRTEYQPEVNPKTKQYRLPFKAA